ncbi:hypothetical protein AOLI_G00012010 [Acnodon oligacanthus]
MGVYLREAVTALAMVMLTWRQRPTAAEGITGFVVFHTGNASKAQNTSAQPSPTDIYGTSDLAPTSPGSPTAFRG